MKICFDKCILLGIVFSFFIFQYAYAQNFRNCYPNCDVTYGQVQSMRIPSAASISKECSDEIQNLISDWKAEDLKESDKLRNELCSAQLGWQIKPGRECDHGGPECCPNKEKGDKSPWEKVDPEIALRKLYADWNEIYSRRKTRLDNLINRCKDNDTKKQYNQKMHEYEDAMSQGDFVTAKNKLTEASRYVTDNVRNSYNSIKSNYNQRVDEYRKEEEAKKKEKDEYEKRKKDEKEKEEKEKKEKEEKEKNQKKDSKNKSQSSGSTYVPPSFEELARRRAKYNDTLEKKNTDALRKKTNMVMSIANNANREPGFYEDYCVAYECTPVICFNILPLYTNTQFGGLGTNLPYGEYSSIESALGMGLGANLILWPIRGPYFGLGGLCNYSYGSNFISGSRGHASNFLYGARIMGGLKKYKVVFDLGKGSRSGSYNLDLDASLASSGYLINATNNYTSGKFDYSLKKSGYGLMYESYDKYDDKQIYFLLMHYSERPDYSNNKVQNTWRLEMRYLGIDLYVEFSRKYPTAGSYKYNIDYSSNKPKTLFLFNLGIPITGRKEFYMF